MSEPRPTERAGTIRAILISAAVLAVFFSPALLGDRQFAFREAGRQHLPIKRLVAEELSRGRFPEWNPYLGLGVPLVSDGVDAIEHPFNLLLVALPFEAGFKAWVVLSYLLAAAGGFLWARQLGGGWHASLACGLAFALSGHLVSSSDNVRYLTALATVPLVLAAGQAWISRGGCGRVALLGCASALCAAGGDPQAWGLAVAALPPAALLLVDRGERTPWALLGRGLLAAMAATVAAAPFVLPILAWLPHSSRGDPMPAADFARWNLHPLRALELAIPQLFRAPPGALYSELFETYAGNEWTGNPWVLSIYAGAALLALAVLGALSSRRARVLVLAAVATTWMAMGANAGFGQLARHLPLLWNLRYWEKLVAWPTLFLGGAAVFGFERLLRDRPAARRFAIGVGAAGAAALLAALAATSFRAGLVRLVLRGPERLEAARSFAANLAAGLAVAGAVWALLGALSLAMSRARLTRLAPALLAGVVTLDLFGANATAYVLLPPEAATPRPALAEYLRGQPGMQRVVTAYNVESRLSGGTTSAEETAAWQARTLTPSWNVPWRIGNFEPYVAMVPVRTSRLRARTEGRPVRYVGLWGFGWAVVTRAAVEAREMTPPRPEDLAAVDRSLPAALVRIPHRERTYLAREVVRVDRRAAMEFALDPASIGSGRTVLEGPVPDGREPPEGEARITSDATDRVEIRTRSDRRALLVLNDAHVVGWSATVDREPVEIFPANYLARGVWVGPGEHAVVFTYRTPLLREGWIVLAAGAVALAAFAALRTRRRGSEVTP